MTDEEGRPKIAALTTQAHELGLKLHPYTFRREELPATPPHSRSGSRSFSAKLTWTASLATFQTSQYAFVTA